MEEIKILKVGDKLPDFELDIYQTAEDNFEKIKFSDIFKAGKWLILFFYPADFTFVCPTELADIGEKYETIKKNGAELVSISTDTHFVHYAWKREEKLIANLKFPMGADPNHNLSKLLGVYNDASGLALRGTFIINPDSTIVASEVNFFPVGRNADELVRKFQAFKYVSAHPSEVCPAKWEPGNKTLKPGKDIVGKIGEQLKRNL